MIYIDHGIEKSHPRAAKFFRDWFSYYPQSKLDTFIFSLTSSPETWTTRGILSVGYDIKIQVIDDKSGRVIDDRLWPIFVPVRGGDDVAHNSPRDDVLTQNLNDCMSYFDDHFRKFVEMYPESVPPAA